jgi:hypothetical protein
MQRLKDSNKPANFQSQAQANGQAWAQQKGAELQKESNN